MDIKEYHDRMSDMHIKVIKSNNIEMIKDFSAFIDNMLYLTSPKCTLDLLREEHNKKLV